MHCAHVALVHLALASGLVRGQWLALALVLAGAAASVALASTVWHHCWTGITLIAHT